MPKIKKDKFDPKKVQKLYYIETDETRYVYKNKPLTPRQLEQYKKYKANNPTVKRVSKSTYVHKEFKGWFSKYYHKSSLRYSGQGHLPKWAGTLKATGGKNPNFNWRRPFYAPGKRVGPKDLWGTHVGGNKKGAPGSVCVLDGSKGWVRQLQIAITQMGLQAEYFRIAVGHKALKVFQESISHQRFYTKGSSKWTDLSDATKKKRARRHTGDHILREYGDLQKSIKIKERANAMRTKVYTDKVPADLRKHKKYTNCYAGWHNEGEGYYGAPRGKHIPRRYIKRQFMGFSSYLNPMTDAAMRKLTKLYLFDSVFLVKKF